MKAVSGNAFSLRKVAECRAFEEYVRSKYGNAGIYDYAGVSLVFLNPEYNTNRPGYHNETVQIILQLMLMWNNRQTSVPLGTTVASHLRQNVEYHLQNLAYEGGNVYREVSSIWHELRLLDRRQQELANKKRVKTKQNQLQKERRKWHKALAKKLTQLEQEQRVPKEQEKIPGRMDVPYGLINNPYHRPNLENNIYRADSAAKMLERLEGRRRRQRVGESTIDTSDTEAAKGVNSDVLKRTVSLINRINRVNAASTVKRSGTVNTESTEDGLNRLSTVNIVSTAKTISTLNIANTSNIISTANMVNPESTAGSAGFGLPGVSALRPGRDVFFPSEAAARIFYQTNSVTEILEHLEIRRLLRLQAAESTKDTSDTETIKSVISEVLKRTVSLLNRINGVNAVSIVNRSSTINAESRLNTLNIANTANTISTLIRSSTINTEDRVNRLNTLNIANTISTLNTIGTLNIANTSNIISTANMVNPESTAGSAGFGLPGVSALRPGRDVLFPSEAAVRIFYRTNSVTEILEHLEIRRLLRLRAAESTKDTSDTETVKSVISEVLKRTVSLLNRINRVNAVSIVNRSSTINTENRANRLNAVNLVDTVSTLNLANIANTINTANMVNPESTAGTAGLGLSGVGALRQGRDISFLPEVAVRIFYRVNNFVAEVLEHLENRRRQLRTAESTEDTSDTEAAKDANTKVLKRTESLLNRINRVNAVSTVNRSSTINTENRVNRLNTLKLNNLNIVNKANIVSLEKIANTANMVNTESPAGTEMIAGLYRAKGAAEELLRQETLGERWSSKKGRAANRLISLADSERVFSLSRNIPRGILPVSGTAENKRLTLSANIEKRIISEDIKHREILKATLRKEIRLQGISESQTENKINNIKDENKRSSYLTEEERTVILQRRQGLVYMIEKNPLRAGLPRGQTVSQGPGQVAEGKNGRKRSPEGQIIFDSRKKTTTQPVPLVPATVKRQIRLTKKIIRTLVKLQESKFREKLSMTTREGSADQAEAERTFRMGPVFVPHIKGQQAFSMLSPFSGRQASALLSRIHLTEGARSPGQRDIQHHKPERISRKPDETAPVLKTLQAEMQYLRKEKNSREQALQKQIQTVKTLTHKVEMQEKLFAGLKEKQTTVPGLNKTEIKIVVKEVMEQLGKELRMQQLRRGLR